MKLIFSSPTYGPIDPQALKSQRVAIMHAANNGHKWVGDASPDKMKFDVARNYVVKSALDAAKEHSADAVFWCDSDVILPAYAISRLASYEKDFITGIYFQRHFPHCPLIANFTGKHFQFYADWEKDSLVPIDGCGFGCVLTSTKLLEAIDHQWFDYREFSEDFDFCLKAKEKGFQLWVDTGVLCGHLADPVAVNYEIYKKAHPEIFGGNDNGAIRPSTESGDMDLSGSPDVERKEDLQADRVQPGVV